jgi:hypothetical protein
MTTPIKDSPNWEAAYRLASQEIPRLREPEGPLPCSQQPATLFAHILCLAA